MNKRCNPSFTKERESRFDEYLASNSLDVINSLLQTLIDCFSLNDELRIDYRQVPNMRTKPKLSIGSNSELSVWTKGEISRTNLHTKTIKLFYFHKY